jgi:hypothetical protein
MTEPVIVPALLLILEGHFLKFVEKIYINRLTNLINRISIYMR